MANRLINVKRNDLQPSVFATLLNGVTPINLTGSTVKFIMKARGGTTTKVNAACVVLSVTAGTVRYDWAGTDTDTAGLYDAEFEITTVASKKYTCPNSRHLEVNVFEDLG